MWASRNDNSRIVWATLRKKPLPSEEAAFKERIDLRYYGAGLSVTAEVLSF